MKKLIQLRNIYKLSLIFIVLNATACLGQQDQKVHLIAHQVIWDKAKHNAFTALESYQGYLYCAFREAGNHHSYDGKIRIIRSNDGVKWQSVGLLSASGEDLRDPKLIVGEKGLMLMVVSRTKSRHFSYTYLASGDNKWDLVEKTNDTWRWGANKINGKVYSAGYSGRDKGGRIYQLQNGNKWSSVKSNLFPSTINMPNETEIFFDSNERMIALVRQERGDRSALLGVSVPPYDKWDWRNLNRRIGSPAGIMLDDNTLLACVRIYDVPVRTAFVLIDVNSGTMREDLVLPSGGDTGYAAIVQYNDNYYVSYNSSNNARKRTSIHLAKIQIGEK